MVCARCTDSSGKTVMNESEMKATFEFPAHDRSEVSRCGGFVDNSIAHLAKTAWSTDNVSCSQSRIFDHSQR